MRNIIVLLAGGFAHRALAQIPSQLYERAACNRDNLFRCFIDQRYHEQASDFCSGLDPSTVTVATTTATVTTVVQAGVTLDVVEITETSTTTFYTETVPSSTKVETLSVGAVAKRALAMPPKCMTNGVTYPASRITSACSCIDVPASTVSATQVVSTETVIETDTVFITPSATTTTVWESISTATTGGIATVTVPPLKVNRLINGDFETGDSSGWQLSPESWHGKMVRWGPDPIAWAYEVTGNSSATGTLRQTRLVYLEPGRYEVGFAAPPAKFPLNSDYWRTVVVFDIINHVQGTNITAKFITGAKAIAGGRIIIGGINSQFDILEDRAGFSEVVLRFVLLPPGGQIDDVYLKKIE
ncbi:hypothetical protein HG530_008262 [Fusarium avenaceum]|nr:hypothetical protein HG530_008262 [Fusarium avenaceum]